MTDATAEPPANQPPVPEQTTPPTANQGLPWWFWHLFTAVGLIMLVAGVLVLRSEINFAKRAQPATGKVIGYTQHKDMEDDVWMYAPIVQFETASGEPVEFTSSAKSSSRAYQVGDPIGVLYDPAKPQQAKLAGAGARYLAPVILLVLACVFTPLGLAGHFYIAPRLTQAS